MAAVELAGDKIVRNLQLAVERLQEDLARVELWAGALGSFTKPVPEYDHGQTRFDLPRSGSKSNSAERERTSHRKTASRLGSPRDL